jgi:hypothetical protein
MNLHSDSLSNRHQKLPVPAILEMLRLLSRETSDDIVLAGVSRTIHQAIDELTALRQSAMEVMYELESALPPPALQHKAIDRRRLC